jgi:hypothetical protein
LAAHYPFLISGGSIFIICGILLDLIDLNTLIDGLSFSLRFSVIGFLD